MPQLTMVLTCTMRSLVPENPGFVHEYAGRSPQRGKPQMRYFGRRYQCVPMRRGGTPLRASPTTWKKNSQDRARLDILTILDHCGFDKGPLYVDCQWAVFSAPHFGLHHPQRALSLGVAGCGYGAEKKNAGSVPRGGGSDSQLHRRGFSNEAFAHKYAEGPTRVQFKSKDPRGWVEFRNQLAEHSIRGSVLTMRGGQARRPSLYDLEDQMRQLTVPTLILTGDEGEPPLIPGVS
ncbi:MAG: hypothetical protein Ct9H300mP16_00050 [Pseudomonadota bacterium]|nr:MAG: hypothetical protein Ct9H300mP16_00050 [Pseudomonadota bacterium]